MTLEEYEQLRPPNRDRVELIKRAFERVLEQHADALEALADDDE